MSQSSGYTDEDIEKFLNAHQQAQQEEQTKSLKKLLSVQDKISIFKDIDPRELKAIVFDLKFVKCDFKDYIVEQNDKSQDIFFIISGECQVYHNNKKVGLLQAGEIFGESGALFATKRNATILCASKEATLLSFRIDENNMEFCAPAIAKLYKNLALQINAKLEGLNLAYISK